MIKTKAWNKIVDQYIININEKDLQIQSSWKSLFCELLGYAESDFVFSRYVTIKNRSCRPDMIVTNGEEDLFIVEYRNKSFTTGEQNILILLQELKINLGILLCNNLYIYNYNDNFDAYSVLEIPLEKNKSTGNEFIQFFSKKNFDKKLIEEFILESVDSYEIIAVSVIPGKKLRANWNTDMQLIITDKGTFIDNIPRRQHGFYGVASPGYDWNQLVGKKIINPRIFLSRGFKWLNFQRYTKIKQEGEASKSFDLTSKKEEKKIIQSIIVQRSVSSENGKCKFVLKDGSYILADDKGKENSGLPWSGVDVKLNIFQIENEIISDWSWEKLD